MKRLALYTLLLLAFVTAVGYALSIAKQNRLDVINQSGQTIDFVEIQVCDQTIRFDDIPPGETVTSPFQIHRDDHFVVQGQLSDGSNFTAECGYVTNGMSGSRADFTVTPDAQVEFSQAW